MSDATPTLAEQPLPPDTSALLLTAFADLYPQEVTALGILVGVFDRLRTERDRAVPPSSWRAQARHSRLSHREHRKVVGGGPAPAMTFLGSRYNYRARASLHFVRGLIWALGATAFIFAADKLGISPKGLP